MRDLCLEMEQPQLADIRDACADLMRSAEVLEEDDEAESASEDSKEGSQGNRRLLRLRKPRGTFPEAWLSKTEKQPRKNGVPDREDFFGVSGLEAVDFGVIDDEGVSKRKKIRVKICGRYIYNYPSERAMSRGGWLQFRVLAKDSNLYDAIHLCRIL